jgi:hypothetical protein
MSQYFIPTDDNFVEDIAKAIAKDRFENDAEDTIKEMLGSDFDISNYLESKFEGTIDQIFETLWKGSSLNDEKQREIYRANAIAAISAINLKLITSAT